MKQETSDIIRIKDVPVELLVYAVYQARQKAKYALNEAICIWLILKTIYPKGIIQDYKKQLHAIEKRLSPSMYEDLGIQGITENIELLQQEFLIEIKNKDVLLLDYNVAAKRFGIDIRKRAKTIIYDIQGHPFLADVIEDIVLGPMHLRFGNLD